MSIELLPLHRVQNTEAVGQKAAMCLWLARSDRRVPRSFVLPFQAFHSYQRDPDLARRQIRAALRDALDPARSYAVRSSTNFEDSPEHSFAGQFDSVLNLRGVEDVLQGVEQVYASAASSAVRSYLAQAGLHHDEVQMAVLIQEMVEASYSGVAVSRNPLTGFDEVVIEAVPGSGEALVQEGVTPQQWVYKWGKFIHQPGEPSLDHSTAEHIAAETRSVGQIHGSPVDLEWIYDGERVFWVQARPLTALRDLPVYSNRISREYLPGIIKPLIWSVNIPLVNSAWIRLFEQLLGPLDLRPEDLSKSFYGRAYFNMGAVGRIFEVLGFPRDLLEVLLGFEGGDAAPRYRPSRRTLRHIPRITWFLLSMLTYRRRLHGDLRNLQRKVSEVAQRELGELDELDLLQLFDELFALNLQTAYHNILVPIQMGIWDTALRRQLARRVDPTEIDPLHDVGHTERLDPNLQLKRVRATFDLLSPEQQTQIEGASFGDLATISGIETFRAELRDFIDRFGHFGESGNDFSTVPWRENRDQVLQMVLRHRTQAENEAERGWPDLRLSPLARLRIAILRRAAARFRLERERVSSLYTYGYGLFRDIFLSLGERLADRGVIATREEVFYLELSELRQLADGRLSGGSTQDRADQRKRELKSTRDILLPEVIYGDQPPPPETFKPDRKAYTGVPTSRGYHTGPLRVIRSLEEMDRLGYGDVLVVSHSDVAWTPLFARAGAVIAESGGMLSHSSIVAREMGIPCVVSVANACLLPDGAQVLVDGYRGEISLLEDAR